MIIVAYCVGEQNEATRVNYNRVIFSKTITMPLIRPSFPPRTQVHCTQKILRITGNLGEYIQKVTGFYKY